MIRTGTGFMFDGFTDACSWSEMVTRYSEKASVYFSFSLEFSTTPTVFPSSCLTPNKKNESGEDFKKETRPGAIYKWIGQSACFTPNLLSYFVHYDLFLSTF